MLFNTSLTNSINNEVNIAMNPIKADTFIINFTQIEGLGLNLYTYSAILLLVLSLILLLAMIGPIFLHVKNK